MNGDEDNWNLIREQLRDSLSHCLSAPDILGAMRNLVLHNKDLMLACSRFDHPALCLLLQGWDSEFVTEYPKDAIRGVHFNYRKERGINSARELVDELELQVLRFCLVEHGKSCVCCGHSLYYWIGYQTSVVYLECQECSHMYSLDMSAIVISEDSRPALRRDMPLIKSLVKETERRTATPAVAYFQNKIDDLLQFFS